MTQDQTPSADTSARETATGVAAPGAAAGGAASADTPPAEGSPSAGGPPTAGAPSRRGTVLRTGFIIAILFVVFGIILPNAVDYGEVLAAFQRLDAVQIALVTVAGLIAWVISGQVLTAVIEGLSPLRGVFSWIILSGIGSSIPFGPWNMGVMWVVARGWGVSNAGATSGLALYGIANTLSLFVLPILTAIGLTLTGGFKVDFPIVAWLIATASLIVFVVVFGIIVAIARSERLASRIGQWLQGIVDGVVRRFGRSDGPNVHTAIMNFRGQLGAVIQRRGLIAMVLAVVSQLAWVGVLYVALRVVGVDTLSIAQVLLAYTMVFIVLIVPISPGGAGIPELLFISILTALAGQEYSPQVAAGVFLYRVYFWFLPIPLAWIALKIARRGRPMLPGADELRDYAHGDEATAPAPMTPTG